MGEYMESKVIREREIEDDSVQNGKLLMV